MPANLCAFQYLLPVVLALIVTKEKFIHEWRIKLGWF